MSWLVHALIWVLLGAIVGMGFFFYFSEQDKFLEGIITFIIIYLLFAGIGYLSADAIFGEEIELQEQENKCKNICESQGLEFVDYIAEECLCREPKFTLVNGGAT